MELSSQGKQEAADEGLVLPPEAEGGAGAGNCSPAPAAKSYGTTLPSASGIDGLGLSPKLPFIIIGG